MSYDKSDLVALNAMLSEMIRSVNAVISEGNANARQYADHLDPSPEHSWTYYGGTKATGSMRRKSMELTRALTELRKP